MNLFVAMQWSNDCIQGRRQDFGRGGDISKHLLKGDIWKILKILLKSYKNLKNSLKVLRNKFKKI